MIRIFFILIIFLLFGSIDAFAAKRYWVGPGTKWSVTTHWSTTSGGGGGASVPGSSDTAYFDGSWTGGCEINAVASVKRFDVAAGYSGTITQTSALTIGTGNGFFSGGNFAGGSSAVTCDGSLTISGTAFTSTSNTLTCVGNFSLSSGSFTHNSGTLLFTTSNTISGTINLNHLTFTPASAATHTISNTLTVNGTLTLSGSNQLTLNTGTIDTKSTITITNSGTGGGGSATISMTGTASPTLTGSGTIGQGALPKVVINKSSGTLTIASTVSSANDWTWTSGTLTTTSSTVAFLGTCTIAGSHTLNNVTFQSNSTTTYTVSNTLTVNGTLTTAGSGTLTFETGTIDAKGAVTLSNTGLGGGGTALITMTGGGSVNLTGNSGVGMSALPRFQINRAGTGGAVTIVDTVSAGNDWTWTSGTLTTTNSHVAFLNTSTITGSQTLNNVTFRNSTLATYAIANTLTVNGILSTRGAGTLTFNTGTIDTKSTIKLHNTGSGGGGSATITLTGSSSLTMYGNSTIGHSALPKLTINKTGGTLTIANVVSAANNWTWTAGTLSTTGSTVAFINNCTIAGSHGLNNVTFQSNSLTPITYTISNTLTVNGTLETGGSATLKFMTGTIDTKSTINLNNAGTNGGGNATITLTGTNSLSMTGNSTVGQSALPKITINKASGTLTLASTISVQNDWTWTAGSISYGSSTVAFVDTLTISGSHGLNSVTFQPSTDTSAVYTLGTTTTLTVNGTLTTGGNGTLKFNTSGSGKIDAAGNITINNTGANGGGTSTITVTGSGTVNFDSNVSSNKGRLPSLIVNKAGGSVTLLDTITVAGNWTCSTDAYLTEGSSTLYLVGSKTISGTHTLNNVFLDGGTYTLGSSDTMKVGGLLKYVGTTSVLVNTGVIAARGHITLANTASSGGGTGQLLIDGTAVQTFTGVASVSDQSMLPGVRFKKTGGSVSLVQYFTVTGDWTYTSGNTLHGTSTVSFTKSKTITGSDTLYNVWFRGNTATFTIDGSTTLTVAGTLTVEGASALTLNTGTINARGNITYANTHASTGGTATLNIGGSSSQTLTGSGTVGQGSLPNVVINNSGTLSLSSIITCAGNWTYTGGTVSAGTSTVAFTGTFNLDGQGSVNMGFWNVQIHSGTRTLTGNLDVNNNLAVTGGATFSASSYTIYLAGNWTNSGTFTSGTSTLVLDGVKYNTISRPGAVESLYNLTVNRAYDAGVKKSVTLGSRVDVTNSLTLTKGRIKTTSSFYLRLTDNAICTGGSDTAYVDGPMRKLGNDAFTFPLGDTIFVDTASYHPLGISIPSNASDEYIAEYKGAVQTAGSTLVDTLESVSTCEHWLLDRTPGSSNVKATLGWNKNCQPSNFAERTIGTWDGSKWIDQGIASSTLTWPTGTITSALNITFVSNAAVLAMAGKKRPYHAYVVLKHELDGGFYQAYNSLWFRLDQEYYNASSQLTYTIRSVATNNTVTLINTTNNIMLPVYGDNRYRFDLYTSSGALPSGFYIMEVTNEKNEKQFIRFRNY